VNELTLNIDLTGVRQILNKNIYEYFSSVAEGWGDSTTGNWIFYMKNLNITSNRR
jgi:hypothetical protein